MSICLEKLNQRRTAMSLNKNGIKEVYRDGSKEAKKKNKENNDKDRRKRQRPAANKAKEA
jgi:hypothetical protein